MPVGKRVHARMKHGQDVAIHMRDLKSLRLVGQSQNTIGFCPQAAIVRRDGRIVIVEHRSRPGTDLLGVRLGRRRQDEHGGKRANEHKGDHFRYCALGKWVS